MTILSVLVRIGTKMTQQLHLNPQRKPKLLVILATTYVYILENN